MLISSRANPRIKSIRALRDRRERDLTGLFLAEGARIVAAALASGAAIDTLIVVPSRLTAEEMAIVERAAAVSGSVLEVDQGVFDSLAFREDPGMVAAVVQRRHDQLPVAASGERSWVAVHQVQHPGNLGTLVRNSDAAGGAGVILTGASTDPYHPVAVRGSLGAIFTQKVIETTSDAFAEWTQRYSCQVIGASPADGVDYRHAVYRRPVVLLMGGERAGLSSDQRALCSDVVRIPMAGAVDSLNLTVAAALLLYEVFRQTS
jgi:TrmH family RNA methyltransferase